ncbi:helix-turn-helix domain-containing protein [Kitasatospora sp. NPDC058965]|uniref:helix-turn-helix domain-containing protein n=1 Tax=Kitasatospora sp. NPDC058965 TaxID=3346682 RepID=UPI0036814BC4
MSETAPGALELCQLLRVWRADAGVKLRREKALPQKEVAARIGVSERWYRGLESGDPVSLSSDILGRISQVLALGPDERMVLYSRAIDGAGLALADEDGEAEGQLALLQLVTAQTQFPAYLTDGSWNILGYNALMAQWFPWVLEPGANLMRWALADPQARDQLMDWQEHAEVYLAMLRFAVTTGSPGQEAIGALLQDLLRDPDCRRIWARESKFVAFRQGHRYRLRLPHVSSEQITVTSRVLLPAYHHRLRCVMLLPSATRAPQPAVPQPIVPQSAVPQANEPRPRAPHPRAPHSRAPRPFEPRPLDTRSLDPRPFESRVPPQGAVLVAGAR